ncbi:hypothetical protein [Mesorhizobium xinjiangense]|uniref:hypothetical protein n=1 Tax=Mesorhizobium xinjiangense TaxID=2678685 RepID=UPI0012ED82EF|nr:hypothetical protein [Mesorhizobium xinjiangense]
MNAPTGRGSDDRFRMGRMWCAIAASPDLKMGDCPAWKWQKDDVTDLQQAARPWLSNFFRDRTVRPRNRWTHFIFFQASFGGQTPRK